MMRRWKIARLMGIDIYLHWSFLLALLLVAYLGWDRTSPWTHQAEAAFSVVSMLAIFVCVLLHELGHARMARAFGIGTRDITICLIGGLARLERMGDKPWEELLIAVAGPAVNVVIVGLLLIPLIPMTMGPDGSSILQLLMSQHFGTRLLVSLFLANLALVLFNMLPAFPMDGGRVLRSLLSFFLDHLEATEVAAYFGMFMAGLLGLAGIACFIVYHNPMLILVAMFVFTMGQWELGMTRRRYAMLREEPIDVLPADDQTPPPPRTHSAEPGYSGLVWDVSRRAWVIWQNGRPISIYGAKPE